MSRLFCRNWRSNLAIACIAFLFAIGCFFARYHLWRDLWIDFRFIRGRVDNIMQRFLEILSGIPNLVVMILMLVRLQEPGIFSIVAAMAITNWIPMGSDCSLRKQ